jgi:hypothetical protein
MVEIRRKSGFLGGTMKNTMILAAALATAVSATSASAATATFDFSAIADNFWDYTDGVGTAYEGTFDQVKASPVGAAFITPYVKLLNAIGSYNGDLADAFFDHKSNKKPGGLGVCHSGFGFRPGISNCSSPDLKDSPVETEDDNITLGESLQLIFNKSVSLVDLLIYDADHLKANGEMLIDGVEYAVIDGVVQTDLALLGEKKTFDFAYFDGPDTDRTATQIYLSSLTVAPVPVPAAGLLLLTALGGLAAARRRKSA